MSGGLPDRLASDACNACAVCEVGPRDGLQNERAIIPARDKIRFVELLLSAGLREIEVTSFVSPRWVPQLADAEEVLRGVVGAARDRGALLSALVPNEKGLERALACGVGKVAVFTAASEGFARKNINASIAESVARFEPVVRGAHAAGVSVRGYVSCIVRCPYDGPVSPDAVAETAERLLAVGVDELDLGETLGVATADEVERVLERCARVRPLGEIVLHLHDTQGRAVECVRRAVALGVRAFDASAGGIGGCPYAPGAAGNISTETLDRVLCELGYATSIDRGALAEAAGFIASALASARAGG